jgi:hypothetical protein
MDSQPFRAGLGKMVFCMVDSQFAIFGNRSSSNHFLRADVAQSVKLFSTLTENEAYFILADNKSYFYPR